MATLEKVMNMKRQGISEKEIIQNLQEQGISPKEISDALAQSQIKQAVSSETLEQEMQPSIMGSSASEEYQDAPLPVNSEAQTEMYQPQTPQQNNSTNYGYQTYAPQESSNEEYYPQQDYGQGEYAESNIDNMIEIAEQVFSEKVKKMQTQFSELIEFKTIYEAKTQDILERLKRIEKMFDQMQISIINKVGNYGKGLENLKKEIEMVEDSFSKVLNKKIHEKTSSKKTSRKKK